MGRKRKKAAVKKNVVAKKAEPEKKPEVAKLERPGIRTDTVSPEDKTRLMKAFVNHKVHCQQCNHQQSLDDCKALIIGTYLTGDEKAAHYNIDTGVLTITLGDKK